MWTMRSRLNLLQSLVKLVNGSCLYKCSMDVRFATKGSYLLAHSFGSMVDSIQVVEHATESPELPDWIKSPISSSSTSLDSNEEDDNFVLPSLVSWIDHEEAYIPKVDLESKSEDTTSVAVEHISEILTKNQFSSPEAVVQALMGSSVEVTDHLSEQILERFGFEWILCLGFFLWARFHRGFKFSPELYSLMVDNMGKCRKFNLMFELMEEMKQTDGFISHLALVKVFRRLSKAGKYAEAIDVFRSLESSVLRKDIYLFNMLLHALAKNRGIEHAESVYEEFKDTISPNRSTFNVRIQGWCTFGKLDIAKKIVDEMKDCGFNPDVVTCTSFIEAHCRNRDFRKVDEMLDYMENNGIVPSIITYTIIVNALGKAKELSKAIEILDRVKQEGCVLDSSFYSMMIHILCKSGRIADARELFEDMGRQGVKPGRTAYNTMIAAAVRESREHDALALLKKMEENACKPDIETYVPLLRLCCKLKRMKVLSFLLNHMFRNNISLDSGTYRILITGLSAQGKLDRACSLFEEFVKKGFCPTVTMVNGLLRGLDEKGKSKEKERILEVILDANLVQSIDSPSLFKAHEERKV